MTPQQEDKVLEQTRILNEAPRMTKEQHDKIIAAMPVDKILKDALPKIETATEESLANERAAREPLPSVSEGIFALEPLDISTSKGKMTIRPMVAYDINIFKMINSPFYQIMMGDLKDEKQMAQLFTTDEEMYSLVYQFTTPPKDIYYLVKEKGLQAFKDKAMEIAFGYNPQDVTNMVSAIILHVFKINLARIQFQSPEPSEGGDKKKLMSVESTPTAV